MKSIYDQKYIEIITRLRVARNDKSMTQSALAEKLGVHQSFVSKVECCERRLDIVEFTYWLSALNLTVDEVLPIRN